jgi:hypothetical protein
MNRYPPKRTSYTCSVKQQASLQPLTNDYTIVWSLDPSSLHEPGEYRLQIDYAMCEEGPELAYTDRLLLRQELVRFASAFSLSLPLLQPEYDVYGQIASQHMICRLGAPCEYVISLRQLTRKSPTAKCDVIEVGCCLGKRHLM